MQKLTLQNGEEVFVYSKVSGSHITVEHTEEGLKISCQDIELYVTQLTDAPDEAMLEVSDGLSFNKQENQ